jgi:dsRNA-specific ribonuclease
MTSNEMFQLADKLTALKDEKKQTEKDLKDLNEAIEGTEYELSNLMASTETQSFTRSGIMFYMTNTVRASSVTERKSELYSSLRENGFGDLVYETVNANSLSAFVKEQIAENDERLPEWLDGLVKIYEKLTVGVRKVK